MVRVGVVGLGAMGQHHARVYSQLNCELVGVADANPERAKEIGGKYNTPYYSDYRELLPRVDAVSIAVPTIMHNAVALKFLKSGVHCLVEKPIAFSIAEAGEMIDAAESNHVNLAVGHIEHFNPAVTKLKEMVDAGSLGKLLLISTRRVGPFVSRITDVGVVMDSAIHDIGVIRYLVGREPVSVFSRVGSFIHPKEDHAIIMLDFSGPLASIEVNWFTPYKSRTLLATGSEGVAYLDYMAQTIKLIQAQRTEIKELQPAESLKLELEDFLRSIAMGTKPSVDGVEGRAILKIVLESCSNNFCLLPKENIEAKVVGAEFAKR